MSTTTATQSARIRRYATDTARAWWKHQDARRQGRRLTGVDIQWAVAQLVEVTGRKPMDIGAIVSRITRDHADAATRDEFVAVVADEITAAL